MCSIVVDELPLIGFVFSNRNSVWGVSGLAYDDVIHSKEPSSIYATLVTMEIIENLCLLYRAFGALSKPRHSYIWMCNPWWR